MHGFVANNMQETSLISFFAFYRIDLERDITRLNSNTMKSLLELWNAKTIQVGHIN